MKIIFNAMNCGLGNNGGSQTIILSANTLIDLKCDVTILDTGKNCFTWYPLKAKHFITTNFKDLPICDVIIGTGIKTLKSTALYKNATKKFHWIRGWETWQLSENRMIEVFKKYNNDIIYLTNSLIIQEKLKYLGIPSLIQYAGIDIYDINISHKYDINKLKNKFSIGGLVNFKHKTKNSHWLFKIFDYLQNYGYDITLYTYGMDSYIPKNDKHIHIKNPSLKQKYKIYRNVDFWLSTSVNEGFHIPPAEYMLTKGIVIGVDSEFNGTCSYLIDNKTGFLCKSNWMFFVNKILEIMNQNIDLNIIANNAKNYIINNIGTRKTNMIKLLKILNNA